MKELRKWLRTIVKTKIFHICIIILIIAVLISFAYVRIAKYDEEGEKEMPFEVSKINVISSVTGENVQAEVEKKEGEETTASSWNVNVSQNNDFYIYVEKNNDYKSREEEVIETISLYNFEINRQMENGEAKIYKPDSESEKELFRNEEKNEVQSVEYMGAAKSNVKGMQMSNQGDLIYFRYTNKNIAQYTTNDEELNYSELLKKANVKEEDLKTTIKFDMKIKLISGKEFNTTVETQVPIEGVVENGTGANEIIHSNELIFKRN